MVKKKSIVQTLFAVVICCYLFGCSEAAVTESDKTVTVELNHLKISIDAESGSIVRMRHPDVGVIIDTTAEKAGAVDVAYPIKEFEPLRLASRYSKGVKIEKENDKVTISWPSLGASRRFDLPGKVSAKVQLRAAPDGRSVIMTCEIDNQSQHPIKQVLFPDFIGIVPFAGEDKTKLTTTGFTDAPFQTLKRPAERSAPFYAVGRYLKGNNWVEYTTGAYHLSMITDWLDLGSMSSGMSIYPKRWSWDPRATLMLHLSEKTGKLRLLYQHPTEIAQGSKWKSFEYWLTPHKYGWAEGIKAYDKWVKQNFKRKYPVPLRIREGLGFRTVFMGQFSRSGVADESDTVFRYSDLPMLAKESIEHGLDEMVVWFWCPSFVLPITNHPILGTMEELAEVVKKCKDIGVNVTLFITVATLEEPTASRFGVKTSKDSAWTYHTEMIPNFNPPYMIKEGTCCVDTSNVEWHKAVLESCKELIDAGLSSFMWDVYLGSPKGPPDIYTLTDDIRALAVKKDPQSVFGGESQNNIEAEACNLDYLWSWVIYRDVRPFTSVFPAPRLNTNIDTSSAQMKLAFADNLYVNVMPTAPDSINGSDMIANNPPLAKALKQCAKLRKQFLPYFTKGKLIGNCILQQVGTGAHLSAYVLPDRVLAVIINTAGGATPLQFKFDISNWLKSKSEKYDVKVYNIDGKLIETKEKTSKWEEMTIAIDNLDILLYEFIAK